MSSILAEGHDEFARFHIHERTPHGLEDIRRIIDLRYSVKDLPMRSSKNCTHLFRIPQIEAEPLIGFYLSSIAETASGQCDYEFLGPFRVFDEPDPSMPVLKVSSTTKQPRAQ